MFKNILVAVDGSVHALKAAETACAIAKVHGARLVVLTVAKPVRGMSQNVKEYM
ncbi:MAG: hypothetical protein FJX36_13975 [Alphaproteobacteria bacterium]|nr:hypothetical protein [Alphaproteobacteria bacterium]